MIDFLLKNKKFAASVSVVSNFSLIVMKLITGVITGSVSIISEAIHSASDLLASFIALFAVNKSDIPADKEHPYGHGKYEEVAGFIEGALIILASFYIVFEAAKKLTGTETHLSNSTAGIIVMLISVLTNIAVSAYLFKVAKKTDSIAIFSDAEHLRTDVYSSLTVLIGLLAIKLTGINIIDPIIAIIVAIIIMQAGYKICKGTMNNLLDGSLPEHEIDVISKIIEEYKEQGIDSIKEIKTRKSGKDKEIIITLMINGSLTVACSHCLCDDLESKIEQNLGNTKITIHVEPTATTSFSCPKH